MKKISLLIVAFVIIVLTASAQKDSESKAKDTKDTKESKLPNIFETAKKNKNFSYMLTAFDSTELMQYLTGDKIYSVFLINNNTFDNMTKGSYEGMFNKKNNQGFIYGMKKNIVGGKITLDELKKMKEIKSIDGRTSIVSYSDKKIVLDNSFNVLKEIECSNGILYEIEMATQKK